MILFEHLLIARIFHDHLKQLRRLQTVFRLLLAPLFDHRRKLVQRLLRTPRKQLLRSSNLIHGHAAAAGLLFNAVNRLGTDAAAWHVDDPPEGKIIAPGYHAHIAEGVFYFLTLIEADAAVDDVRNPCIEQSLFKRTGQIIGTIQNRNVLVGLARIMETYDLGSDVGRLHLIVCAGMVNNLLIRLPLGKQLLLETVAVVADHGVGTIQNAGGRAVVLIEHDRNGIGKILRKVQNDVHIRSAPRIDRLVRITDNVQAVVRSRQLTDQLILFGVDVLKLINENI